MLRFASILLLAVAMVFHANARAAVDCTQYAPGFLPCPPVANQPFVIRLNVPSGWEECEVLPLSERHRC